jgi:hypothetical protein
VTAFGDDEPEDAWDPGDPTDELVACLIRRARLLEPDVEVPTANLADALRSLGESVARARRRYLTGRDLIRADQLDDDIAFLWVNRL